MSVSANSYYHFLYNNQLTHFPVFSKKSRPDRRELGWVFLSSDCERTSVCRTYRTLYLMQDQHTYYTPNTFYDRRRRTQDALRWLNAFVIDVDVKNGQNVGLTLPDLLDMIQEAGLPSPTFVVRTPSGGFHVYFVLDAPRKAYSNNIKTYRKLQLAMAKAIQGDVKAIGPERYFRIPTADNVIYQTHNRVSFADLIDWHDINSGVTQVQESKSVRYSQGLLQHAAVQAILRGVDKGSRDNACYTLALAFKADGYTADEAESELQDWNSNLVSPLSQHIIARKVRSAYKSGSPAGPSAEWIRHLSGVKFAYQAWESAKPRKIRKYSHYEERASDMLYTLAWRKSISGSQRGLASMWGMSLSVFQEVTKVLVERNRIQLTVSGKGRGANTTITIVPRRNNVIPLLPRIKNKINVPDSNTLYLGGLVGGLSLFDGGFLSRFPRGFFLGPFP
ncbi:primase C-terminal domain-containing protein [Paenibacillus alvei]|uniref:Primase C-terminal domain-containing protein n=1 Tax=Paenibacillus alvei TaxID=44250 RepID=A0ABT4H7K9_PAEAL|nr:primase C-terminal domain-containing protein [Paenibacillus alvei]EJW14327.1 hypothetical protein PAV_14c00200 [Paenibacillus alvei DSM 29]MCY9541879.1 primase C-terminal domain-containing protein [Paenibacillus alvei]MCY9737300.1 primase C-terminal domain-containing protein [Paenibacillus alvei]MCY9757164.1 primase C-terminal domain-containing protein [Paenibacillus alvei]MCY9764963.1 primase C-terminal domain-containing protein [Paenibacillus alvei]